MNNQEIKDVVLLYLEEYHNSLFLTELKEEELNKIFETLSGSIYKKALNALGK